MLKSRRSLINCRHYVNNLKVFTLLFILFHVEYYFRACLKNHSRNLHTPLCGIFHPNSVAVARYGALIRAKYPTNCDAHLAESLFQTHSRIILHDILLHISKSYCIYIRKNIPDCAVAFLLICMSFTLIMVNLKDYCICQIAIPCIFYIILHSVNCTFIFLLSEFFISKIHAKSPQTETISAVITTPFFFIPTSQTHPESMPQFLHLCKIIPVRPENLSTGKGSGNSRQACKRFPLQFHQYNIPDRFL